MEIRKWWRFAFDENGLFGNCSRRQILITTTLSYPNHFEFSYNKLVKRSVFTRRRCVCVR